jgi:TetR/AcrR family transcriptional regulator, transcriptional repressor of bet genes
MPKRVDHARRRDELAELVVRVVEAEGAEAATFRRIAEAGDFSMGVLTHYFRDKDELIANAFQWLANHSFDTLDRRLRTVSPGIGQLSAVLSFMVPARGEITYPGVWLALWSAARHNPALAAVHRQYYARWRRLVARALRDARRLGQIAPIGSLADRVDLLVGGIDGVWLGVVMEPRRYPPVRRARLVAALVQAITAWEEP